MEVRHERLFWLSPIQTLESPDFCWLPWHTLKNSLPGLTLTSVLLYYTDTYSSQGYLFWPNLSYSLSTLPRPQIFLIFCLSLLQAWSLICSTLKCYFIIHFHHTQRCSNFSSFLIIYHKYRRHYTIKGSTTSCYQSIKIVVTLAWLSRLDII